MLNPTTPISPEIAAFVLDEVRDVATQACILDDDMTIALEHKLVDDLSFSSLTLARLVMELTDKVSVDPFAKLCHISEIRTVADLARAYTLASQMAQPLAA